MEVSNNGSRPQTTGQVLNAAGEPVGHGKRNKHVKDSLANMRVLWGVLLVGVAVLIVALIFFVVTNTVKSESSFVNKTDYQAVFVNVQGSSGGQAYFGHVVSINTQYIELSNVFYLEPGSTSNQFTLNNLSCALYNPQDTMLISRDQVVFWENLKSNSQVTSDINKWYTDNLQCSSSAGTTTGATGTTGSTSTTTK